MPQVRVLGMRKPLSTVAAEAIVINPCSNSESDWQSGLSPFKIGPCKLYGDYVSQNFECAWQFSKTYKRHVGPDGNPSPDYFKWAQEGWASTRAIRYPMGRGAKPAYSYWDGQKLGYIEARKKIYGPLYIKLVFNSPSFKKLKEIYQSCDLMVLRDFDGYDHVKLGMSLTEVVNTPFRKMGHSFVLAMLLLEDPALSEFNF